MHQFAPTHNLVRVKLEIARTAHTNQSSMGILICFFLTQDFIQPEILDENERKHSSLELEILSKNTQ